MNNSKTLTIFFPCYNDSKTIGKLVKEALRVAKTLVKDYEVLVIDDGSTDNSRKILQELAKKEKHFRLIVHPKNRGYGGALRTGFKEAKGDLIFYTDGDGQYDVAELPLLFSLLTSDISFVNGIKMERKDPTYRIFIGNLYNFFVRWAFWLPVYDTDCDFRLIRKSLLNKFDLNKNTGCICVELVKKSHRAKAVFRQVSVHHFERPFGKSQFFKPKRIFLTLIELSGLWLEIMVIDKFLKQSHK